MIFDLFKETDIGYYISFVIYSFVMLWLNYLTYILLKDLTDSLLLKVIILAFLSISILLSFAMPFEKNVVLDPIFAWSVRISMLLSMVSFGTLLYFMIMDIFKEKHEAAYRLWGSASIFILIGSFFSIFYTVIESIVYTAKVGIDLFLYCNKFSYFVISGVGVPDKIVVSDICQNISIFESLISNLFIVLLVGRILSK